MVERVADTRAEPIHSHDDAVSRAIRLESPDTDAGSAIAFSPTMEPTKQPAVPVIDESTDPPLRTEPSGSGTFEADRRIYLWRVMAFTDVEIAAHLGISVRDVHAAMARCRTNASGQRGAEDKR
jgi:hypothetical protein